MTRHIYIDELPPDLIKKVKKANNVPTRKRSMTKDDVRSCAIAVLHPIKHLSKSDRQRVLNHAMGMNKV